MRKPDDARQQFKTVMDNGTTLIRYEGLGREYDMLVRWHDNDTWIVKEHNSIFTRRFNGVSRLRDITILKVNPDGWGVVYNGKHYNYVCILACEDGHVVRGSIEAVPQQILDSLESWGFVIGGQS